MGLLKIAVNFIVELTTFTSTFNPFVSSFTTDIGSSLGLYNGGAQVPLNPPHHHPLDCPEGKVCFKPDGSSKGFRCEYDLDPKLWVPCNNYKDRGCWIRKKNGKLHDRYSITTDYEDTDEVPRGKIREHWLYVNQTTLQPAFIPRNTAKLYNDTYPGPKIEACWGDQIVVHVTNLLKDNGTTVHWHGIRQLNSTHMDGVAMTQCPITYNNTFTYNFTALQYGHTWYHSHYAIQYADGLAGPLVIYGPSSHDWDDSAEPFLISDWVQTESAFSRYQQEKTIGVTRADVMLVNGIGHNTFRNITSVAKLHAVTIAAGKRTLLRLINASIGTSYIFSIDSHNFTVIAVDLVAIEPYTTNSLMIGIGQRYTIVIQGMDQPIDTAASLNGNFWIRTRPADGCNLFTASPPFHNGIFNSQGSPSEPFDIRTALLRYHGAESSSAPANGARSNERASKACEDEPMEKLQPVVKWIIDDRPLNNLRKSTFLPALQTNASEYNATLPVAGNYSHWMLRWAPDIEDMYGRKFSSPMWIDFARPTILEEDFKEVKKMEHYAVIDYNFADTNGFIYMVIDGRNLASIRGNEPNSPHRVLALAHPIHWHGSDVVILGQSSKPYDPKESPKTWVFDNPPRRDVVMVPAGGYVAVAFKPDNPGAWLIHCHIAWHSSAGLAFQMLIQGKNIRKAIGEEAWETAQETCEIWKEYIKHHPHEQDDSGI